MNFEHYKNFAAIIDAGTISAASKDLLIAQPALSNQLKSLEDEYGAQLVIRHPRHVELTDAGRILYEKVKAICYLEDAARKEITACASGTRGTLWLGTSPANPDPLFYQILLDYHVQYPEVTYEIFERNSSYIVEQLENGMVEIGLIRGQAALLPPDVRPVLTIDERLMACFHRDHITLSPAMEQIPLRYLKELPISISHGLKKAFTNACERDGFTPYYLNISASRSTSQLWARDKKTVSIMAGSFPGDDGDLCFREIGGSDVTDLTAQRMFAICRNRRLSAVAENFLQFCRRHPSMRQWLQGSDGSDTEQF